MSNTKQTAEQLADNIIALLTEAGLSYDDMLQVIHLARIKLEALQKQDFAKDYNTQLTIKTTNPMQQYVITNNERYSGDAVVVYNAQGQLIKIDTSATNMDAATLQAFKAIVPVRVQELEAGTGFTAATKIIAQDYEVSFEDFWKKYPLKRNRYKAEECWRRMSKGEQIEAYINIDEYTKWAKKQFEGYQPMLADRYLRSKEYKTNWKKV
jgi:hypothetical protein